jgi:hypothetical protein
VLTPENEVRRVKLRQTGAGQYEGQFEARGTGSYLASVGGDGVEPATAGTSLSYPPEYRTTRANGLLMNQVAAMTGGLVNPPALEFFRLQERRVKSRLELWQILLWISVGLWLLDIGVRRLFLDDEQRAQIAAFFEPVLRIMRPLGAMFRRRGAADRTATAAATLGALQARRKATQARLAARNAELTERPTAEREQSPGSLTGLLKSAGGPSSAQPENRTTGTGSGGGSTGKERTASSTGTTGPTHTQATEEPGDQADRLSRLMEARRKARRLRGE